MIQNRVSSIHHKLFNHCKISQQKASDGEYRATRNRSPTAADNSLQAALQSFVEALRKRWRAPAARATRRDTSSCRFRTQTATPYEQVLRWPIGNSRRDRSDRAPARRRARGGKRINLVWPLNSLECRSCKDQSFESRQNVEPNRILNNRFVIFIYCT